MKNILKGEILPQWCLYMTRKIGEQGVGVDSTWQGYCKILKYKINNKKRKKYESTK